MSPPDPTRLPGSAAATAAELLLLPPLRAQLLLLLTVRLPQHTTACLSKSEAVNFHQIL